MHNTQKQKSGKKKEKTWENLACGWRQVDMIKVDVGGGRGPHLNNTLDFIIKCSIIMQDPTDVHKIKSTPLDQ